MDSKSLQFCALDAPTLGALENGFAPPHGRNVWRDAECANSAEGRGTVGRTIKTKAVTLAGDLGQSPMASATPEVVYDTPGDALWINEQGQILDCTGLIEEMFGYWTSELKGRHVSMLLPDLAHTRWLDHNGDNSPRRAVQSCGAIAFVGVKPAGDEGAYSEFLKLISTKAGRELTVILRSQIH